MSAIETRLRKLERKNARQTLIWCDDPSEMDAIIAEMIEAGEISESDRVHCVHWENAKPEPGRMTHEDRLKLLR